MRWPLMVSGRNWGVMGRSGNRRRQRWDSDWRPYVDQGQWQYSDNGWSWHSDYSWGWAAFHYGRWTNDGRLGWVWVPDKVWGPAWVSWRLAYSSTGWAPLPGRTRNGGSIALQQSSRRCGLRSGHSGGLVYVCELQENILNQRLPLYAFSQSEALFAEAPQCAVNNS